MRGFSLGSVVLFALGTALVAGFKPYFLFPFILASAVWFLFAKVKSAPVLAPFLVVIAGAIAMAGVVYLGRMFQEFSVENVVDSVADHQMYGAAAQEGSGYLMGNAETRSVGGQLAFAPFALLTTLARPLPFEIRNLISASASVEICVLTYLLGSTLRRSGLGGAKDAVLHAPVLTFAIAFTVVAATAVGLATTNFGTLSRYRAPILPFYAAIIVAIRYYVHIRVRETVKRPALLASPLARALRARDAARGASTAVSASSRPG
jgi:hypothetical protein